MTMNSNTCNKWMTVIGVFFIFFPLGVAFFWGTLVVYTSSYEVVVHNSESNANAPWILSIRIFATAVAAVLAGCIKDIRVGKRLCLLAGIVLLCGSYFCTYFTLQFSSLAFTLVFSIFNGLGDGLNLYVVMDFIMEWVDEQNSGFLISLGRSGAYFGAIIANQLTVYYINPENKTPDYKLGPSVFFSQREIIDRVPYVFIYLGTSYLAMQILGFVLLKTNNGSSATKESDLSEISSLNTSKNSRKAPHQGADTDTTIKNTEYTTPQVRLQSSDQDNQISMTTREMIKTRQFYVMFFGFFLNYSCSINILTYFKSYGQTLIHDDHFLSNIGILIPVANIVVTVINGFVLDKFTVRTCMIFFNAFFAAISLLFYLSLYVNRWVFAIATLLFTSTGSYTGAIYNISIVKVFGREHQACNIGVVTMGTVGNLALSPIIGSILANFGWFYVFLVTSLLNLIVIFCFLLLFKPISKR